MPTRRLPSLDLLRGFEATARHLSFTRAAEEMHVTQSAMSRQIKELEDQLGTVLFERRNRALLLTGAGRLLLPVASQVLALVRQATDGVRAMSDERTLYVTTHPAFATLWLIPRLAGFVRDHQDIDVRISTDTRILDLERDGIDMAIRYCPQELVNQEAVLLESETIFPVCSPVLLRGRGRSLHGPDDLQRHVLLHFDDPDGRWPWLTWKGWSEALGIGNLRSAGALRFSGYDQVISAAIAGNGVALGRSMLVNSSIRAGHLLAPFEGVVASKRSYWIVVSRQAAGRPEVDAFIGWVRQLAAKERKTNSGCLPRARTRADSRRN